MNMAKLTVTRKFLFTVDQEIKRWQYEDPTQWLFHQQKIKKFYEQANMHLKIIEARFKEIKEKYVEKGEGGNFLTETVDGQPKWKLLKSKIDIANAKTMNAEDIEKAFSTEGEKMFSQQLTIEW